MYRINDRQAAIRQVQKYLIAVSDSDISLVPSGVFDENTRLSVIEFQKKRGTPATGVVDIATFEHLYIEYRKKTMKDEIKDTVGSFISFPLRPGDMNDGIFHINRTLARLLDYYGVTHRLRASTFYSDETALAVRELRRIYLLEDTDMIDEIFYRRMINDHILIGNFLLFE